MILKKSASEISGEMEADQTYIAAFHAGQYLSDSRCQQVIREVSRMWQGRNSAVAGLIAQFHPLTTEQLKQAPNLDVYILQSIGSRLNRVRFVKKDGIAYVNPPPGDYRCESCYSSKEVGAERNAGQ